MRKKKLDPLSIAIYSVIILAALYIAAGFGTALDLSKTEKGEIDFSVFTENVEQSLTKPETVFSHLTQSGSLALTFVLVAAFAIGIYILLKYTSRKRLHRRGVEHGSARWSTEKEEKFLADKPEKKKGEPEPPKSPYETDNNIILTQEVRMSLNTRQHRENLNVLVIGGSGPG